MELVQNVMKVNFHFQHERFKGVSDESKDLIKHLLVKDTNLRYSATEALNHKWFIEPPGINQIEPQNTWPDFMY